MFSVGGTSGRNYGSTRVPKLVNFRENVESSCSVPIHFLYGDYIHYCILILTIY